MLKASIKRLEIKSGLNSREILRDINFTLQPNKIYTILGKNGSGKSTLIKSLTGLLDNRFYTFEGEVIFNNHNIFSLQKKELLLIRKQRIKYVFQDAVNSFDHLRKLKYYFKSFMNKPNVIDELLLYFLLPPKNELLKMYAYELSGGMAQRVSLVLALLYFPQILILDEPTSGIDAATANLYLHKLKDFARMNNNSVLLVTQDIQFAEAVSDKIAFLNDGSLSIFSSSSDFYKVDEISLQNFISAFQEISK